MTDSPKRNVVGPVQSNQSLLNSQNIFTHIDHAIARRAIAEVLTERECQIVLLRFWKNELLEDIGAAMRLPVSEIEQILNHAFSKIKEFCFSNENFSRKQKFLTDRNAA